MTQPFRIDAGGLVDREAPCRFTFDGRAFDGFRGDTLASALLANGVRVAARSFRYHRPRGVFAIGSDEPNALVQLGTGPWTEPNTRATVAELFDGLTATSQNRWPSLRVDLLSVFDRLSPLLAAGFFYRTFKWPARAWTLYERAIRRVAGLGRAPAAADPDTYEQRHAHCDVLVIGAGPAGLAAAAAAADHGADVIVIDEHPHAGGWLCRERARIGGGDGAAWAARTAARLSARTNVRLLLRTTAFGYYDHDCVALAERLADHCPPAQRAASRLPRQRLWRVRARRVVLATGALEQPLVFANNDLPGILLAGAARGYVNQFRVRPGRSAVVATNNDSAWRTAFDLHDAGVAVAALVDARADVDPRLREGLRSRGIRFVPASGVVRARGRMAVTAVEVSAFRDGRWQDGITEVIACDLLCVSGGWAPALHLHAQSGGRNRYDESLAAFVPDTPKQSGRSAGAAAGIWDLGACLANGVTAGTDAALACGAAAVRAPVPPVAVLDGTAAPLLPLPPPAVRGKRFVDLQNDVTVDDIELAHREGYRSVEHLKRYTTLGMGTDQGKTSNLAGLTLLAAARGDPVPAVGTTTFRPPYTPVTLATLAGEARAGHLAPVRRTPMHGLHEKAGAVFTDHELWRRPARFPRRGETASATVAREYAAVRDAIGVTDLSTLGKFEIRGVDCVEFLNRAWMNAFPGAEPGRVRHGVLLRDDGLVLDDGLVTCLAPEHWYFTCSTTRAAEVQTHLEFLLDALWPELDVHLVPATEQWAVVCVAGPRGRAWLDRLVTGARGGLAALGPGRATAGAVAGLPARLIRSGFCGTWACEIHVPAGAGADLWRRLLAEGGGEAVTPFGLDALHVLRIAGGHPVAGAEIDGRTCPYDLGLEHLLERDGRFVGFHGLQRPALQRADRLQLVGLLAADPDQPLREGAQLVASEPDHGFGAAIGHITSATFHPGLRRHIALALLRGGRGRHGATIHVADPLRDGRRRRAATVVAPPFQDAAPETRT
jgi:sarcosine oxidase subunit alpha